LAIRVTIGAGGFIRRSTAIRVSNAVLHALGISWHRALIFWRGSLRAQGFGPQKPNPEYATALSLVIRIAIGTGSFIRLGAAITVNSAVFQALRIIESWKAIGFGHKKPSPEYATALSLVIRIAIGTGSFRRIGTTITVKCAVFQALGIIKRRRAPDLFPGDSEPQETCVSLGENIPRLARAFSYFGATIVVRLPDLHAFAAVG